MLTSTLIWLIKNSWNDSAGLFNGHTLFYCLLSFFWLSSSYNLNSLSLLSLLNSSFFPFFPSWPANNDSFPSPELRLTSTELLFIHFTEIQKRKAATRHTGEAGTQNYYRLFLPFSKALPTVCITNMHLGQTVHLRITISFIFT